MAHSLEPQARGILDRDEGNIISTKNTQGGTWGTGCLDVGNGSLAPAHPDVTLPPERRPGPERTLPRRSLVRVPCWPCLAIGPHGHIGGSDPETAPDLRESTIGPARSDPAQRHQRRPEGKRAYVVAVLGIDGSGKSTLSRLLAQRLACDRLTCLIGDSLALYQDRTQRSARPLLKEKLRRWLSAQAKGAGSLARYKIPKIGELLLRNALLGDVRRSYGPDLVLMDGCPVLNMTAWSALYKPEMMSKDFCRSTIRALMGRGQKSRSIESEFPELRMLRRLRLTRFELPDLLLFLDVDPEISLSRIVNRGGKIQAHETAEKLGRLRDAYHLVVDSLPDFRDTRAVVLDGNRDLQTIVAEGRAHVERALADRSP